jgi:hypothetical protein
MFTVYFLLAAYTLVFGIGFLFVLFISQFY